MLTNAFCSAASRNLFVSYICGRQVSLLKLNKLVGKLCEICTHSDEPEVQKYFVQRSEKWRGVRNPGGLSDGHCNSFGQIL